LSFDLSAEKGMQQAFEILARNEQGLTLALAKAQSGGLQAAAFKKAIEEEARKKGASVFADELRKNNGIVGSLPGAEEAARAMMAAMEPANRVLKKVAEAFERASQSEKRGAASSSGFDGRRPVTVSHTRPIEEAGVSTTTPAYNICQSLPGICPLLVNLGLAFLAAALSTITSGQVRNCVGTVYRIWIVCENNARNQPFPQTLAARARCRRELAERVGRCISTFLASHQ
jgi:hypothetical protein